MNNTKLIGIVCLTILFRTVSMHAEEIHDAVMASDLNKVRALIETNPSLLESKDNRGLPPLHIACEYGKVDIANFLIDKGADVNAMDNANYSPLIRACLFRDHQDLALLQRLIDKGADVNWLGGYNGNTALHFAAHRGGLDVAKLLIENGADVNIFDKYNGTIESGSISGTVLQVAINNSNPNEAMAKMFVESGAKLNKKDPNGNTELHLAAFKGYADLTNCLIEHGADVNVVNNYNHTALYYATKHGYRGVADVLIAAGANENTIVEANYGKARQLTEKLKDGEAYLWYHSFLGYAIKTKGHLIAFKPNEIDESSEAGLANAHLNPNELAGQKIILFSDYPGWEVIKKIVFGLTKRMPEINWVFDPNQFGNSKDTLDIPSFRVAAPNESFSVGGIQVHTIPALSGGMGYLIEADGLKIFYGGLHISSNEAKHIEKYRKEIDFLKPFGPIDIAILTVQSHSNEIEPAFEPYLYLLDELEPKAIYLMGANIPQSYPKCIEVLRVRNIPVRYPESEKAMGERFHYLRDGTQK
jgi:ankyrin repeat protein